MKVLYALVVTAFWTSTLGCSSTDSSDRRGPKQPADRDTIGSKSPQDTQAPNTPTSPSTPSPTPSLPLACKLENTFNIIGGTRSKTTGDVVSSTVSINDNSGSFCTGTIIGPQHIVTAAHCLTETSAAQVRIGFGSDGVSSSAIKVVNILAHPKFSNGLGDNQANYDIGIIAFEGSLPDGYRPANIASPNLNTTGDDKIIAGYGITSDSDKSNFSLNQVIAKIAKFYPQYKELDLEEGTGRGTCNGDSGGPIFPLRESIASKAESCLEVLGATSRAARFSRSGSCDEGNGIFTDVRLYQGWMSCNFKRFGKPLPTLQDDDSKVDCQP